MGLPKEEGAIVDFAPRKGRGEIARIVEFKNAHVA